MLTEPLHAHAIDWLMRNADEPARQRLNSLTTPHATAWLSSSALWNVLSQGEFVAGLKWAGGHKVRDDPYICRECSRDGDVLGVHTVTCQRTGSISRGHSLLRDTVAELLSRVGISTAREQRLPGSLDRPADLLVSAWKGKTIALDFTIITPTRASASVSSTSTTTMMDQAAHQKQLKSRQDCEVAGWLFQPFVADTYGALRADACEFVKRFIHEYHHKFYPMDEAEAGRAIWSTISSAVISRAAQQINRLALTDAPLGLPLRLLELRTARSTTSTLPAPSTHGHQQSSA